MDKIVEALIEIEQTANKQLDDLTEERRTLSKRVNDEIARRKAEIDQETQKVIEGFSEAAAAETDEKIGQILKDSQRRAALVEAAFDEHREAWRKTLLQNITSGKVVL